MQLLEKFWRGTLYVIAIDYAGRFKGGKYL